MAKIKLKIVGSQKKADLLQGDTVHAENILELIQHQRFLDDYEYDYSIFLNGVKANDESRNLKDGDEVVLVPVASGG